MNERPLSPFLNYRMAYTMVLSFSHRASGVALALGLVALAGWLMATANGPGAYASLVALYSGWLFRILLCAWLFAFLFHFANGIRHLFWDAGLGLEKAQARRSAAVVVVWTVLACAICLWAFL
jgi:succinate dehydrogenase / fumarate reductase cytochrome b subunit